MPLAVLLLALSAPPVDFARDVRPLLESRCVRCHGPKKHEAGLRLDLRSSAMDAVIPRHPDRSELVRRIMTGDAGRRMPPSGKALTPAEAGVLREWIAAGAEWPDALAGDDGSRGHWAFKTIRRPPVPATRGLAHHAIDAFILARLEMVGRTFAPPADAATLTRRLHLDLTGLPPDGPPEEPGRLAERLLASPAFGERWGRHWLDLARYAESDGYENDRVRKGAWVWRDWVVSAFNADLPLDRFTVEQLAGDLLPAATADQKVATGLHRNTLYNSAASGDKEEFRTRAVKDRVETTGTAWLGLTLGCAQCHSHKYDPVPHREYYRLYAFFDRTADREQEVPGAKVKAPTLAAVKRVSHVHRRGNFLDRGDEVKPGTPAFLPPLKPRGPEADRLDLARWLVSPENPLTARVLANQVWQHLFGEGLVRTPEDFGRRGERPTHPELLDWLASELVANGWSRKALIRIIVASDTYRQSSARRGADDPDNRLLGRQNRFRLEAEAIRDAALTAAGLLDRRVGGPSIVPPFPKELPAGQFSAEALLGPTKDRHRRGVYIHVQRTLTHPSLEALDAPDGNQPCPRRERAGSPVQALALLNNPVFTEAAFALGGRLIREARTPEARIERGFRLCLGRAPDAEEMAVLLPLTRRKAREADVWAGVARVLLNLDEFVNRE